jgi:hypothetical protein
VAALPKIALGEKGRRASATVTFLLTQRSRLR